MSVNLERKLDDADVKLLRKQAREATFWFHLGPVDPVITTRPTGDPHMSDMCALAEALRLKRGHGSAAIFSRALSESLTLLLRIAEWYEVLTGETIYQCGTVISSGQACCIAVEGAPNFDALLPDAVFKTDRTIIANDESPLERAPWVEPVKKRVRFNYAYVSESCFRTKNAGSKPHREQSDEPILASYYVLFTPAVKPQDETVITDAYLSVLPPTLEAPKTETENDNKNEQELPTAFDLAAIDEAEIMANEGGACLIYTSTLSTSIQFMERIKQRYQQLVDQAEAYPIDESRSTSVHFETVSGNECSVFVGRPNQLPHTFKMDGVYTNNVMIRHKNMKYIHFPKHNRSTLSAKFVRIYTSLEYVQQDRQCPQVVFPEDGELARMSADPSNTRLTKNQRRRAKNRSKHRDPGSTQPVAEPVCEVQQCILFIDPTDDKGAAGHSVVASSTDANGIVTVHGSIRWKSPIWADKDKQLVEFQLCLRAQPALRTAEFIHRFLAFPKQMQLAGSS